MFRAVDVSAMLGMVEEKLCEVLTGVWSNHDGIRGARGAVNSDSEMIYMAFPRIHTLFISHHSYKFSFKDHA